MKKYVVSDTVQGREIRAVRQRLRLTQAEFAELVNMSKKTIERWESGIKEISGPIVPLLHLINEYPQLEEDLILPEKKYPLRLRYMERSHIRTVIDVDESLRKVWIKNYTNNLIKRAFGQEEHPSYEDYEAFLESRCFPRSRDKMKLILKDLDLPFYDPFMIIEKTGGRMAEDDFWIRIER